jgi:hypothetical protein
MSLKYTVTCSAMGDREVALIKSLLGIIGNKVEGVEWEYRDELPTDVVIIDTDATRIGSNIKDYKPRAIITYASPDKTLIPNTFALYKPARARDLIEVLTSVQARLAG